MRRTPFELKTLQEAINATAKALSEAPTPDKAEALCKLSSLYMERKAVPSRDEFRHLKEEVADFKRRLGALEARFKDRDLQKDPMRPMIGRRLG